MPNPKGGNSRWTGTQLTEWRQEVARPHIMIRPAPQILASSAANAKAAGSAWMNRDLAARRCRTVEPRHHNRDQEEEEEGEALIATAHQTIDQAGCQKAVIEPLICGQNPGLRRKIGRGAEGLPTARRVPEEHLQDENIGMDGRDQRGKDLGNHAGLRGVDAAWDSPVGCLS
nr:hypothetical protein [Tistrella sp.]